MSLKIFCSSECGMIIFKYKKKKENYQPRTLYMAKLSLNMNVKLRLFSDKLKLKEFLTTRFVLQEMLESPLRLKNERTKKTIQNYKALS